MTAESDPPEPLHGVMARYLGTGSAAAAKRGPGRPLKRTPEYLRRLLVAHGEAAAWHLTQHGCRAPSDRKLFTAYFAHLFAMRGERVSRANSPEFQRALKTLLNELSDARRLARSRPENLPISGMTSHV